MMINEFNSRTLESADEITLTDKGLEKSLAYHQEQIELLGDKDELAIRRGVHMALARSYRNEQFRRQFKDVIAAKFAAPENSHSAESESQAA